MRRRFLIDGFQYRLIAYNLIYFFSILMVTAALVFISLRVQLTNESISIAEREEIAFLIMSLYARIWPAILVAFVLLTIHSVFVTHRIAGALYRFRLVFQEVAGGNLTVRANLRKTDYLTKEADALNAMLVSLDEKMSGITDSSRALYATVGELSQAIEHGSEAEAKQVMLQLRSRMMHAEETLNHLRLADQERAGVTTNTAPGSAEACPEPH